MKRPASTTSSHPPPRGIIRTSKGVGITTLGLPMADHFFQATGYRLARLGSNVHLIFGSQTAAADEEDKEYRLAIEMVYPLEMAAKYLYKINWDMASAGSKDPFAKVLEKSVANELPNYVPPKKYKVPSGNSYRSFACNFSIMSLSTGQAAIEFFEAPPGTVVEATFQKHGWRPNSDVRAILNVVLSPIELYRMLVDLKEHLKDVPVTLEEIEEVSHV